MAWPTVTAGQQGLASQYNALSNAIWNWGGNVHAGANSLGFAPGTTGWDEFRVLATGSGSGAANDILQLQANSRTTSGGSDVWTTLLQLSVISGFTAPNGATFAVAATVAGSGYLNFSSTNTSGTTGWYGFRAYAAAGANAAGDALVHQYNARTTAGGADSWANWLSVAASGAATFGVPVTISSTASSGLTVTNASAFELLIVSSTVASASAAGIQFTANAKNWQIYNRGNFDTPNNRLAIYSDGGVERLTILPSGNVGIGNANPGTLFSVGTLFTVDSSGNVVFGTPAGLSFGANWQNWTPTVTPGGSMTVSGLSGNAQYIRIGPIVHFYLTLGFTLGGTLSNQLAVSLPVSSANVNLEAFASAITTPTTSFFNCFSYVNTNASSMTVVYNYGNNFSAAGSYVLYASGSYRCA